MNYCEMFGDCYHCPVAQCCPFAKRENDKKKEDDK